MGRRIVKWLVLVGIVSGLGPVAASLAKSNQPASRQGVPAGQRVARNASQVPSDWIAAHPEGGCMANPFSRACGAPGHPITSAYYPSAAQLAKQLDPKTAGDPASPVVLPSGESLGVAVSTSPGATEAKAGSPQPKAAAAGLATCLLRAYAPARAKDGSDVYMYSQAQLSNCTINTIEATACTSLYQRTSFKASGCDSSFGFPKYALASAWYNCGHSNVITYTNQATGYIESSSGGAGFNATSKSANHSCT